MSQLSLYNFLLYTLNAFTYLYVLTSHIWAALLFYPVGIFLSLYILGAIAYMVLSAAEMFKLYLGALSYLFCEVSEILDQVSNFAKYFSHLIIYAYTLAGDAIKAYSMYLLVFYLKRIEFYIFWLFIVLAYC